MEVILLQRVSHLGNLGAKVRVKPGFGRNYLIPTGKALPATKRNLEIFEARRAELALAMEQRLQEANARALRLEGVQVSIAANAGEEGRLFGSVGPTDIVEALRSMGHELTRHEVRLLDGHIRHIGTHEVELHLMSDEVIVKIQVLVTAA